MGAATVELNDTAPSKEAEEPSELEREVEGIRENINGIVGELDRRGHELVDWRLQLRKHAFLLAAMGAGCLLGLGLTVTWRVRKKRRENRPLARARRLREAVSRMVAHPELVAQPRPSLGRKAVGAAITATVGVVAKTLLQELMAPSLESGEASIHVVKS